MTVARHYDSVRTAAIESLFNGRTIPAGMEGVVLEVRPDGTCLVALAFRPQTAVQDGDFAQAVLTEDQALEQRFLDRRLPELHLKWATRHEESPVARHQNSWNGTTLHQLPQIPGSGDFLPNFLPK